MTDDRAQHATIPDADPDHVGDVNEMVRAEARFHARLIRATEYPRDVYGVERPVAPVQMGLFDGERAA